MFKTYCSLLGLPFKRIFFTPFYGFSANIKEQRNLVIKYPDEIKPFTFNNLWDNEGARHKTKRLGRGSASGKGNSCGRGQRGQRSRASIGIRPQFEGGQSPLQKRLPKWGKNPDPVTFKEVNLNQVLNAISRGVINPNQPITIKDMRDAGIFKRTKFGVKLLGRGSFGLADKLKQMQIPPLHFEVSDASEWAIKAIKEAGGSIKCIYRTPLLLREHLKPQKYDLQLRDPLPPAYVMKQFHRMEARGADVIYNKPKWVRDQENTEPEPQQKQQQETVQQIPSEVSAKEIRKQKKKGTFENTDVTIVEEEVKNLQVPANREEGCGRTKIRRRKQTMFRSITYKL